MYLLTFIDLATTYKMHIYLGTASSTNNTRNRTKNLK